MIGVISLSHPLLAWYFVGLHSLFQRPLINALYDLRDFVPPVIVRASTILFEVRFDETMRAPYARNHNLISHDGARCASIHLLLRRNSYR